MVPRLGVIVFARSVETFVELVVKVKKFGIFPLKFYFPPSLRQNSEAGVTFP